MRLSSIEQNAYCILLNKLTWKVKKYHYETKVTIPIFEVGWKTLSVPYLIFNP